MDEKCCSGWLTRRQGERGSSWRGRTRAPAERFMRQNNFLSNKISINFSRFRRLFSFCFCFYATERKMRHAINNNRPGHPFSAAPPRGFVSESNRTQKTKLDVLFACFCAVTSRCLLAMNIWRAALRQKGFWINEELKHSRHSSGRYSAPKEITHRLCLSPRELFG